MWRVRGCCREVEDKNKSKTMNEDKNRSKDKSKGKSKSKSKSKSDRNGKSKINKDTKWIEWSGVERTTFRWGFFISFLD